MVTTPDPAVVAAACKDDLGRIRQDELPLSTRLRNGPSFVSNYDDHANHYDRSFKDSLHTNWNVPIQDEETERMAGLIIPDARPWANSVNLNTSFGPQATAFNSGSTTGNVTAQTAISNSKPRLNIHQAAKSKASTTTTVSPRANRTSASQVPKESESSAMYMILDGDCTVEPDQGFGVQPKFKIHANRVTNVAYLTFITQKKKKKFDYNVLDLSRPELKGDGCHIAKVKGLNLGQFRVQLSTREKTEVFHWKLYHIQKSAIQIQLQTSNSSKSPVREDAGSVAMAPSIAPAPRIAITASSSSTKMMGTTPMKNSPRKVLLEKAAIPVKNDSENQFNYQPESQPVLVDLNTTPTKGTTKAYSIDELAEDLYDFVATVRHRLHESTVSPFKGNYDEVEDAAFTVWSQKDAVHASDPPLRKCLPQFLELLSKLGQVSVDAKIKSMEPIKIDSLTDFDDSSSISSGARHKYSAGEIMRMRSHAAPFSADSLSPAPVTKNQRTELDGLAAIQQFKGWLGNQNQENAAQQIVFKAAMNNRQVVDTKLPTIPNKIPLPSTKPAEKEKSAVVVAKPAADTKPPALVKPVIAPAAKPKPKGLSSSRWAN